MKRIFFLILIVFSCFISCEKKDLIEVKPTELVGTWLVVYEKRLSDNWTQSEEIGITTDWQIINPFSDGMSVTSIKVNGDETFYWNVDKVEDWEHFEWVMNQVPEDSRNTYSLGINVDQISLYTRFEYVGIIKTDTTKFRMSMLKDHLILENEDVQLKFLRKEP